MALGVVSAMGVPPIAEKIVGYTFNPLYTVPVILVISAIGSVLGTLFTEPEEDAILMQFYRTVNPWGAWGPVRAKVMQADPTFRPNPNFGRDSVNVMVGIVWQLCLTALPIYLVLRQWHWVMTIAATLVVTTVFIKFNWYDKLEKAPDKPADLSRAAAL